jgi:hypothetical protein
VTCHHLGIFGRQGLQLNPDYQINIVWGYLFRDDWGFLTIWIALHFNPLLPNRTLTLFASLTTTGGGIPFGSSGWTLWA